MKIYTVQLPHLVGKPLYIDNGLYNWVQTSTPDLLDAKWYRYRKDAEKMAEKVHGTVILCKLDIDVEDDYEDEEEEPTKKELTILENLFGKKK